MGQSVSPAAGVGVGEGAGVASFPPHPDAKSPARDRARNPQRADATLPGLLRGPAGEPVDGWRSRAGG